ncbi:MAG: hypothetical protein AABW50_02820 [Nanoarchaeota archaeon]
MGFFGRKDKVIDLSERYRVRQKLADKNKKEPEDKPAENQNSGGLFSFFSNVGSQNAASSQANAESSEDSDEKRKKLAKRLVEMTNKIEEISNQIYRLQQRIEVLERRANIK